MIIAISIIMKFQCLLDSDEEVILPTPTKEQEEARFQAIV